MFGVRCAPVRLPSLLAEQVADGTIVTDADTHWQETSLNQLQRDVRARISVRNAECVWYVSGRIYFPTTKRE
jgi:hypothetical protein